MQHYSVLWFCILTAFTVIGIWTAWIDKSHPAECMPWSKVEHLMLFGLMYGACYFIFFFSAIGDDDSKDLQMLAALVAGFYTGFNIFFWIHYRNKKWGATTCEESTWNTASE